MCNVFVQAEMSHYVKGFPSRVVPVYEVHGVYGIQCQHDLRAVELGPLLWDVIITHQIDEVTARHIVHHHIQILVVLE